MRIRIANPKIDPWMIAVPIGGVAIVAGAAWAVSRMLGDPPLPAGTPDPRVFRGVPFAEGGWRPRWPVVTTNKPGLVSYEDTSGTTHGNWARKFGAPREGTRWHVGIDIYADYLDPVIAMEDGTVLEIQHFNLGTYAILVQNDSGIVVLYGEVENGSWKEFGVYEGARVSKGNPIARVGCQRWTGNNCVSHMLHLETYVHGTTKNRQWYQGKDAPSEILDPTRYLLRASERA